jgi:hypothetical protein
VDGDAGEEGRERRDGAQGVEELRALLALASAPAPAAAAGASPDSARLGMVLAAYREAADTTRPTTRTAAHRRSVAHPFAVRCTVVALLLSGAGVAAASTGILPAPIQRVAHRFFGGEGIPAPSGSDSASGAASSGPSDQATPTATPMPTPSALASNTLTALCLVVSTDTKDWQDQLDAAEQAALITAAGGQQKVKAFCKKQLADATQGATAGATASSGSSASPSATASPDATATHGNAHSTHSASPNPHSTGH